MSSWPRKDNLALSLTRERAQLDKQQRGHESFSARRNAFSDLKRSPENWRCRLAPIRAALGKAGVIFVDENGEGPGVRLKKKKAKSK